MRQCSFEQRAACVDAIPTDLRHREPSFEFAHFTGDQAEAASRAHLVRDVEEQLMTDADAEERCAAIDGVVQCVVYARVAQPLHRRGETADARQHDFRRASMINAPNGSWRLLPYCC